ncbi:MAG: hypothetical protein EZS28_000943 [Streblomastix strix]|uniref:Uncharacterized protein n=1 Tax=Streblomastix strix TaxID=222440 RepID=A0A5J4X8P2_9EUKA|nr:MAG: hypothetical protein EZS28_000943 [Streblomastix strix]
MSGEKQVDGSDETLSPDHHLSNINILPSVFASKSPEVTAQPKIIPNSSSKRAITSPVSAKSISDSSSFTVSTYTSESSIVSSEKSFSSGNSESVKSVSLGSSSKGNESQGSNSQAGASHATASQAATSLGSELQQFLSGATYQQQGFNLLDELRRLEKSKNEQQPKKVRSPKQPPKDPTDANWCVEIQVESAETQNSAVWSGERSLTAWPKLDVGPKLAKKDAEDKVEGEHSVGIGSKDGNIGENQEPITVLKELQQQRPQIKIIDDHQQVLQENKIIKPEKKQNKTNEIRLPHSHASSRVSHGNISHHSNTHHKSHHHKRHNQDIQIKIQDIPINDTSKQETQQEDDQSTNKQEVVPPVEQENQDWKRNSEEREQEDISDISAEEKIVLQQEALMNKLLIDIEQAKLAEVMGMMSNVEISSENAGQGGRNQIATKEGEIQESNKSPLFDDVLINYFKDWVTNHKKLTQMRMMQLKFIRQRRGEIKLSQEKREQIYEFRRQMEANSELEMLRNVKKGVLNLSDRSKVSTLKSDSGPDSDNE